MVCTACKDPCLCTCCQIRLRSPECSRYRKLRHRLLRLLAVYFVDDQAEAVAKVDQGCCDCRSLFGSKYETCRIFTVAHGKRIYFDTDRAVCDRRANLKHVRFQYAFLARYEVVGVILHEGSTLCIRNILAHDLHQADHSCRLPVTLAAKSIALLHQTLDCKTRKLLKRAEITEVCHDCLVVLLLQKTLETDLDLCLYRYMSAELCLVSALKQDLIFVIVLFYQSINIRLADRCNCLCDLIDRICIYFPAEFDLCLYLVTLGNGYVSHVVSDTHYADMAALHDTDRGAHPGCDTLLHLAVIPVADDHLALNAHAGHDVAILTVAVCGLVLVHEIHIDRIVRNLFVELCMKMKQRFTVLLKTKDPGFCR